MKNFLHRSFFYYVITLALIATVDFDQVHTARTKWFLFLIKESTGREKTQAEVMYYDYMTRLAPNHTSYWIQLAEGYKNLGEVKKAEAIYRKAGILDAAR